MWKNWHTKYLFWRWIIDLQEVRQRRRAPWECEAPVWKLVLGALWGAGGGLASFTSGNTFSTQTSSCRWEDRRKLSGWETQAVFIEEALRSSWEGRAALPGFRIHSLEIWDSQEGGNSSSRQNPRVQWCSHRKRADPEVGVTLVSID